MTIVSKDILRWILVVTTYCGDITQKDLGTAGGPAYKYLFEIFDCLDQTGRVYRNEIRANLNPAGQGDRILLPQLANNSVSRNAQLRHAIAVKFYIHYLGRTAEDCDFGNVLNE